jgi:hypothetical protein
VIELAGTPEQYEDLARRAADTFARTADQAEPGATGTAAEMDGAATDGAAMDGAGPVDEAELDTAKMDKDGPVDKAEWTEPPVVRDTARLPAQLTISHQSGSRAGQIDRFPLDAISELTMGRDPGCAIVFDAQRDDTVSRRHAVIRIALGDPLSFTIVDLGSLNGTMLNGERISAETGLLPDDTVQMGLTGPSFVFDVEPRPPHLVAVNRRLSGA